MLLYWIIPISHYFIPQVRAATGVVVFCVQLTLLATTLHQSSYLPLIKIHLQLLHNYTVAIEGNQLHGEQLPPAGASPLLEPHPPELEVLDHYPLE